MAITAAATYREGATSFPTGYVLPVLTPITKVEDGTYLVDLSISNADAADPLVGLANVLAAAETDFETVTGVAKKIGETSAVAANLTVFAVQRLNTLGVLDGNIFVTGTEVYRCTVSFEYQ